MYALMLLAAVRPSLEIPTHHVDVIELNYVYDQNGLLQHDQFIFWRWYPRESGYHVAAWRMAEPGMRPQKRGGRWAFKAQQ